jgi:fructosamine-3-kinase
LADESGRLTDLIDWDRACWGDPEIEFAVLDYCGISEPAFWEGYGAGRDCSREAKVRQVFYLLYEIQKYIVIRRVRGHDPQRVDAYRRQSLRLAEGLGRGSSAD